MNVESEPVMLHIDVPGPMLINCVFQQGKSPFVVTIEQDVLRRNVE